MISTVSENSSLNGLPPDISLVHAFAQLSATVLDLDDLLATGLDMLFQTFQYDLLAVLLIDNESNRLVLKAWKSQTAESDPQFLQQLVSEAMETGTIIKEENLSLQSDDAPIGSCLGVPLLIGRLVIGSLIVANFAPYHFSPAEEQILTIFASQLTVAITNAQLYRRTREQQQQELIRRQIATHLQHLSTIINATLDLDEVLRLILEHIEVVIPYRSALLMLLQGQELVVRAASGFGDEIGLGLAAQLNQNGFYHAILAHQYPAVFHDVTQKTFWAFERFPAMENVRAWIGAPLVIKSQIIGILTLHHPEPGYFDQADLDLVNTFANQAAIAIDNARLYQRERQKVKQFQTIAKIGRQATEIHEVQPLLETVVTRLYRDLDYEFVAIFLYDSEADQLLLKAASDLTAAAAAALDYIVSPDGSGIISTASRAEQPLLVNDISAFEGHLPLIGREHIQSELAIPLLTKGQVVGLLDLQSTRLHAFSPDDLTLLHTIADQLAVAIATANLFEERDRRMAELLVFNEIGLAIADPRDLKTTLNNILKKIKALYQVEGTSLLVLEEGRLHFKEAVGISEAIMQPFILEAGEGFAGWVVEHNQPLRVDDAANDPRHYKKVDETINFTTKTLLGVPVQIEGRVLGVIEIINRLDGLPFTRDDEVILSFIASAIAITMENSRLFEALSQKADQMAGLFEASRSLTNLDLSEVLHITVRQVIHLVKAEVATVYLIDPSGKLAVPGASYSSSDVNVVSTVFEIGQGAAGWVLQYQKPLRINDMEDNGHELPRLEGDRQVRNLLSVPLIARERIVGILETLNKQGNQAFTGEDEAFITVLASQAAAAIHNALLFQAALDGKDFALALGKAGIVINRSLNPEEVLEVICQQSLELFDVDGVTIWRREQTKLACLAAKGVGAKLAMDSRAGLSDADFIGAQVVRSARPAYQHNLNRPAAYLPELTLSAEAVAVMGVPLLRGNLCIGALLLISVRDPYHFNDEDEARAVIYTNQITSAMENARLYQETRARLAEVSTLYTLAYQMTSDLDIERLLENTINVIRLALDCLGSNIFLLEENELVLGAQNGSLSLAGHAFINKAVQQLLKKPHPMTLGSLEEFAPILEKEPPPRDIKSLMIVPLIAHGRLSGALAVYDKRPNTFGEDEGRLLTIVAAQVASALENSKLFTDLQRHARNMEETLAELQEFSRLQNEFVQNVSHELRTPLTFVKAYVDLILEETLGNISDSIRDSLEIVARRTQDLNRLVSDIITHQQLQMGVLRFEEVNLADLIRLVTDSAGPIAEQNELKLNVRLPQQMPLIQADPNRLGQVLDNLVGNAIKFTGPGGEITVSATIEDLNIRIEVADTGIGITKGELNKIFNRFYQVDGSTTRRFGGTGLGLTIVKQIIEAHQGQVSVDSEPGQGSTFSFTLPLKLQLDGETVSRFDL